MNALSDLKELLLFCFTHRFDFLLYLCTYFCFGEFQINYVVFGDILRNERIIEYSDFVCAQAIPSKEIFWHIRFQEFLKCKIIRIDVLIVLCQNIDVATFPGEFITLLEIDPLNRIEFDFPRESLVISVPLVDLTITNFRENDSNFNFLHDRLRIWIDRIRFLQRDYFSYSLSFIFFPFFLFFRSHPFMSISFKCVSREFQ